jgi:hypothetical protein
MGGLVPGRTHDPLGMHCPLRSLCSCTAWFRVGAQSQAVIRGAYETMNAQVHNDQLIRDKAGIKFFLQATRPGMW